MYLYVYVCIVWVQTAIVIFDRLKHISAIYFLSSQGDWFVKGRQQIALQENHRAKQKQVLENDGKFKLLPH